MDLRSEPSPVHWAVGARGRAGGSFGYPGAQRRRKASTFARS